MRSKQQKLTILLAIFTAAIIAANLMGTKIVTILGISMSVAIFVFPLTFLITDAVAEVYGHQQAKQMVHAAMVALVIVMAVVALAVALPPAARYEHNESYRIVFGNSLRIMFASLVAFIISQRHDIWAFEFWKKQTKGKHLWLRNNLSTIVSQFLDTTLFMFLAFYHMAPKFGAAFVFSLIIPYWLVKVTFALADTPFVYALVNWLKHGAESEQNASGER